VTVGLFVLLFTRFVDVRLLWQELHTVAVGWLLVATVVKATGMLASIVRWDLLLRGQGIRVAFRHLVGSFLVGRFFGAFLPSTIGLDAYRAYDIAHYSGETAASVATILVEKVIGFFALSALVLITLPFGASFLSPAVLRSLVVIFVIPVTISFLLLLYPTLFERILDLPLPGKARYAGKLEKVVGTLTIYHHQRRLLLMATLLGLVVHTATATMYYFTARAVHASVSLKDILFVGPLMITATVGLPTIGGAGAREFSFVYLLARVGVPEASAFLLAHLGFWAGECISLAGGVIYAARPASYRPTIERLQVSGKAEEAKRRRPAALPADPGAQAVEKQPGVSWLRGLMAASAAGLLAGGLVGVGETLFLALAKGSLDDLIAWLYATIAYGILGLVIGVGIGIVLALAGRLWRLRLDAARYYAAAVTAVLVPVGFVVARFRVRRDIFHEQMSGRSGMLVTLGLLAGFGLLAVLLYWGLPALMRRRWLRWLRRPAVSLGLFALLAVVGLVIGWLPPFRPAAATELPPVGRAAGKPNVLFVMVDTLRADHMSAYGYEKRTTPNADALARDGVLYRDMAAQASWTKPSVATQLSSLYPSSHRAIRKTDILPDAVVLLPEVLYRHGWVTGGFANNINVAPTFNFGQGYVTYEFLSPSYFFGASEASSQLSIYNVLRLLRQRFLADKIYVQHFYQDAEVVTDRALEWLEEYGDRPFFLFLHYMDPHDPYFELPYNGRGYARVQHPNPPVEWAGAMSELYDDNIAYFDAHFGRLIEWLKAEGLYDNTLIVFTGDHGEEFHEHGGWWHGTTLYEEQVRVPLIIKFPGQARAGTEDTAPARSLDIAPTVLDVLGLEAPPSWQGVSLIGDGPRAELLEDHEGNVIYSINDGRWKLITANAGNHRGLPELALFDLQADPDEQHNLAAERPEEVARLQDLLAQAKQQAASSAVTGQQTELSEAAKQQLQNLGY